MPSFPCFFLLRSVLVYFIGTRLWQQENSCTTSFCEIRDSTVCCRCRGFGFANITSVPFFENQLSVSIFFKWDLILFYFISGSRTMEVSTCLEDSHKSRTTRCESRGVGPMLNIFGRPWREQIISQSSLRFDLGQGLK